MLICILIGSESENTWLIIRYESSCLGFVIELKLFTAYYED